MNQNEAEKIALERQAAELFARCYAGQFEIPVSFLSHNAPRKPDVSCVVDKTAVDLEIAHLYGSQAEAQRILGKALSDVTIEALRLLENNGSADERLIKALNRILLNKAAKHYDSQHVWLVIRNANPQWTSNSVLEHQGAIQVPASHPFAQIWLLGDFDGDTGLVRLFP